MHPVFIQIVWLKYGLITMLSFTTFVYCLVQNLKKRYVPVTESYRMKSYLRLILCPAGDLLNGRIIRAGLPAAIFPQQK